MSKETAEIRERFGELSNADPSASSLVEIGELARQCCGHPRLEAAARGLEAQHARLLGQHKHALIVGDALLELWPSLRSQPVPEKDEDDAQRRLVWGMKYVAGSAMDLPEIPLSATDRVLTVLDEILEHFEYQKPALWTLQARRAFIAGDPVGEWVEKLRPTITRYHHAFQCADCPGCVLLQLVEWSGPEAVDVDVEEVLAPVLGRRSLVPDPEQWRDVLDLLYGKNGICENAQRSTPVLLSRAYVRAGRIAEALQEAQRAMTLAEGVEADRRVRALVARAAVAVASRSPEAASLAREVVERASALESAGEQLDAFLVAHGALHDDALVERSLALAERLDSRIERKRHVAATRLALERSVTAV